MNRVLRKGFTIVEMLMVLGIIAVLLGLITSAAMTAIRHARDHKASACQQIIQSGIATYRSQKGEWPGPIKGFFENGFPKDREVPGLLKDGEYDEVLKTVVEESLKSAGSPLLDVTGLLVAPQSCSWCVEFREAVKENKRHGGKLKSISQMVFGYQHSDGHFSRFKIIYNDESDHVTVTK